PKRHSHRNGEGADGYGCRREDKEGRAGAEPGQDGQGAGRGRREMTGQGAACAGAALGRLFAADVALAQRTTLAIEIRGTNAKPARPTAPVNNLQELSAALAACWSPPPADRERGPVDVIFQVS